MTPTPSYDLIVIGGGPAGSTAALRACELGASVALIERGAMGGTCTNDGCVPTRVLARAARLMALAGQYADYGMDVARPELDFQRLLARSQAIVYEIHEKKQLIAHLEAAGATVYAGVGEARFVDPHTVAVPDGRQFHGDKFILAAGGRARRLDFPGEELALTHGDIWRVQKLPKSVAIVGGAATGCQLAAIFNAFGSRVTVLDVAPRILTAEDSLVSQAMTEAFTCRGIDVTAGIGGIERIERAGGELALVFRRGVAMETLRAEAVVLSTGWLGNLDGLNLAAAGVETNGRYVVADDACRTTAPHIFACGDIDGRMMLVQSAGYEARIAAENAVLGGAGRQEHQIVPHGGFTNPEYASVGPTEAQAVQERDCVVAVVPYADLDRAVIDGRTEGFCKLIVDRETHRLVAAHVVGEQALEIVHVAAAGMAADMWVEQLAELQIAYPTFTAILGLAARRIVAELGVLPLAPEWLALGRRPGEWEQRDQDHG
ncbi:MAG TPA: NAD(P)/FAD-dependent oxidoreductase [Anaerolineae bacterium]|nr:NAD(P)/FAD-dependent oxidoreductase [Anaerolineae bacterium]HNU02751.1 NAD(P)/FAD-dependent oxidoreductase [Anaerolineae bacterium]